ncbi:UDP-3-O-(3-hydroxymyristoyl)glucosamine N-acyltransferase [Roseofilum sp. Guam]|uniref:UDP-3-O-(3-hydroxymyristoyl)glucosamine N-acyltransferase n=1 Tax=Roseofilum sp. Guam TaxID=2821502 RepID=UPI001B19A93F|nr:UDP-3-O-(3-hydroxymyristoyl)glucosamine N-acyltransferase [Roseofilum sp. Guam]MBP0029044.1 UDP-3-O-(3-hydroxymyristoyl)glucosamine N-acyltransferase [Roseofilum sp. Guam]
MKLSEIIEKLGKVASENSLPDLDPEITGVAPVDQATPQSLSFIEGRKFINQINTTEAIALIIPPDLIESATERGIAWIATREPRLLFAQVITLFYQPFHPQPQIHPTATIAEDVQLGQGVYIGPHVVIESGVKIGDGVCIHGNVVIYPQAEIGDRTVLHANCTIHERTLIGQNCVIHSGAAIGSEGFGFVPTPKGWFKMEQSGRTVLEDRVEVGCNSAIDRPAVGETRIGSDTKIDNLVQIGHGSQIGSNCAIAGQTGMAGGTKIGNKVLLAGQVGIANNTVIGDNVIASAKAGVHGTIAPGSVVSGNPAVNHPIYLKASAIYKRLPDLYQSLKEFQKRLSHLESR